MIIRMSSDRAYSTKKGFYAKYSTFESDLSGETLSKLERNCKT